MTQLILNARRMVAEPAWQRLLAFLAAAGVVSVATLLLLERVQATPSISQALLATLFTAGATGLGSLPVVAIRALSDRVRDALLGFGAGVMLAASFFSLLAPALQHGTQVAGSAFGGLSIAVSGVIAGAVLLMTADRWLPHEHFVKGREGGTADARSSGLWLFVVAITLHNIPEGLAVGVAQGDSAGQALTIGIAIQNMPEGLIVALALVSLGIPRWKAAALAFATGLAEPLGGVLGAIAMEQAAIMLPWSLAFAAGAMLFIISHEVIPETHRNGNERAATIGLLAGFVLMMAFDTILR